MKLFAGPAVLAKQLETRWGEPSSSSTSTSTSSSSSQQCQEPPASAAVPPAADAGASEVSAGNTNDKRLKTDVDPDANPDANNTKQPRSTPTATATARTRVRMNRPYLRRTLLYCRDPLDRNYFPLWKSKQRSANVGQDLPHLNMLAQLFGHAEPEEYNAALLEDKNTWQQHYHVGTHGNGGNDDKNGEEVEEEGIDHGSSGSNNNNNSDGASMNSSEENSFRDVSVLRTPPPRKRKRRITPTTTPTSARSRPNPNSTPTSTPSRKKKAGGRVSSTLKADGGGGDAVSSPSSSASSSSSRQHTKLFFDVQMAQSPSKVLSPTTAEMKYGKAFPPYEPKDRATGKWIPPQKPRSAYELFVDSTRGQARLHLKRRDRNNQVCDENNGIPMRHANFCAILLFLLFASFSERLVSSYTVFYCMHLLSHKFRKKLMSSWRCFGPMAIRRPSCTGSKRRNGTGRGICTRRGFIREHSNWRPIMLTTPTAAGTANTFRQRLPVDLLR